MPAKTTLRSCKARAASRSSLSLECLESRLALFAPIGNVTAQLVGSTLLLTGDALDNALVVSTATGGRMAVLGGVGTTINGSATPFVTSRAVTSIVANLNAGNDVVGFTNNAEAFAKQLTALGITPPFDTGALQTTIDALSGGATTFALPGGLAVTTAAGNDFVGLIGNVGGSVAVNLGSSVADSAGNVLYIGEWDTTTAAYRIGGALSIAGGDQRDVLIMRGTDVGGGVAAALGNGSNFFTIVGLGSTIGSMAYTGGTGADGVNLVYNLAVRSAVSILTGPRGADVAYLGGVTVGGNVVINTGLGDDGDYVTFEESSARGGVSVATGRGMDTVEVGDVTVGLGLAVSTGDGNDSLFIVWLILGNPGDPFTAGLNTVIDAGAGNDQVAITRLQTPGNVFVYLGPGNDALTMVDVSAFAAFLYGGTGTNSLGTNAATRSGIRVLKYYQFQTVADVV